MKNAANNGSDKISHTRCTCGDEELASVIIEFSVWRRGRGRVAAVTCLIVLTWNMAGSGGSRCVCFLRTAELNQDLRWEELEGVAFLLYLSNETPTSHQMFLISWDCVLPCGKYENVWENCLPLRALLPHFYLLCFASWGKVVDYVEIKEIHEIDWPRIVKFRLFRKFIIYPAIVGVLLYRKSDFLLYSDSCSREYMIGPSINSCIKKTLIIPGKGCRMRKKNLYNIVYYYG